MATRRRPRPISADHPGSRFAFVDVRCRPDGENRTRVNVSYEIQSLTEAGEAWLEAFNEDAYSEMIDEWSDLIRRSLN